MSMFKQKYTLAQRIEKCKKQLQSHPDRIVIIAERHPKSSLPQLPNPRFLCEKNYKFNMIKKMLQTKIMQKAENEKGQSSTTSFFLYINNIMPREQSTMDQLYEKYKDQDGFLYLQYGQMESY